MTWKKGSVHLKSLFWVQRTRCVTTEATERHSALAIVMFNDVRHELLTSEGATMIQVHGVVENLSVAGMKSQTPAR